MGKIFYNFLGGKGRAYCILVGILRNLRKCHLQELWSCKSLSHRDCTVIQLWSCLHSILFLLRACQAILFCDHLSKFLWTKIFSTPFYLNLKRILEKNQRYAHECIYFFEGNPVGAKRSIENHLLLKALVWCFFKDYSPHKRVNIIKYTVKLISILAVSSSISPLS